MKFVKKILIVIFWVLLGGSMIFLMGFIDNKNGELKLTRIEVSIQRAAHTILITEEDVMDIIGNGGSAMIGKPFAEIHLEDMENRLKNYAYISDANVHARIPGHLYIEIIQREPLARIINQRQEPFYISTDGHLMPLHPKVIMPTILATGMISDSLDPGVVLRKMQEIPSSEIHDASPLELIYNLARIIQDHAFLKAQIEQIYINEAQDAEMIPKVGNHMIIFGDLEGMEGKFNKLIAFYREGVRYSGWDVYQSINLTYKNQIVCTK
ncbi:MAG: hypothetical protein PHD61_07570 [Bacteroidales bacterium]|nr:FtsQ-type POTRA domain-containing protein [Lentimicrobiaceae bacterium]MDD5695148.1 hypothetical protein [Bacteroidales bacterium]